MRVREFDLLARAPEFGIEDEAPTSTLTPLADPGISSVDDRAESAPSLVEDLSPSRVVDGPPVRLVDPEEIGVADAAPEAGVAATAFPEDFAFPQAAPEEMDPVRILRDRPDVYAAFYSEFYGPNNDRHSPAWHDRVGGDTPEHFARYWYNAHGRFEGYTQESGTAAAPAEGLGEFSGRTTIDGIPLAKILADRPDVFQAFFTEYYGPNNDPHSDAWVQRVGGATVENYANYWYNAHGKVSGYVPSASNVSEPLASPVSEPPVDPTPTLPSLPAEDPSLDPWNHPAIYPDWQPPYPGWTPPGVEATAPAPQDLPIDLESDASTLQMAPGQSLFDNGIG